MKKSDVDSGHQAAVVERWHVYNACHVEVATYSTEAAAAAHVASWPALYYGLGAPSGTIAPSVTGHLISTTSA